LNRAVDWQPGQQAGSSLEKCWQSGNNPCRADWLWVHERVEVALAACLLTVIFVAERAKRFGDCERKARITYFESPGGFRYDDSHSK